MGIEPRASSIIGKCSLTELNFQSLVNNFKRHFNMEYAVWLVTNDKFLSWYKATYEYIFASSNSLQALQYLAKKMRTKEQSEGSELGRAIQVALT